jgi:DNA polymerase (family X)
LRTALDEAAPPRWLGDLLDRLRTPGRDEVDDALRALPPMTRALARAALDHPALASALDGHDILLPADLDRVHADDHPLSGVVDDVDALLADAVGRPVSLGRAWMQGSHAIAELTALSTQAVTWHRAGGVRRIEPLSDDVVLLAVTEQPHAWVREVVGALPDAVLAFAGSAALALTAEPEPIVVRAVPPAALPAALLWYTGPRPHVAELRARGQARGVALHADHVMRGGTALSLESEDDVYRALDLPPVPVELRHRTDIVEMAARHALPTLVDVADIRGDLHVHSLWSDGRDSIMTMVQAARTLGYEYLAITDHSPSARASRVLTLEKLARQKDEIAQIREEVPDITILHGIEVDIQPDGRLDVPDVVLATLDVVLASLHEGLGHPPERLLQRYTQAMRHPLVNILTHPANRAPGRVSGHAIDFDRLFEEAAATGTAVEIDGAPGHLDLDAPLAERAARAGAMLVVDSDCHMADRLGRQMAFGVGLARRAALGPTQILNTRGVAEIRAFVQKKRSGQV